MKVCRFLIMLLSLPYLSVIGQEKSGDSLPKQYVATKTTAKITVDGKALEAAWNTAPWTDSFVDIEGKSDRIPVSETRCKLLWDEEHLYVFTRFDEQHIWANQKIHDGSVFHDNAFEIFFDPDGDTHNYMEFQINALETVWDLFLTKPYRDGGAALSGWDIKELKKAVYIEGTVNNSNDIDRYWSVELAIPFKSLRFGRQPLGKVGETWRMNFSRVQWEFDEKDQLYERKRDSSGRVKPASYFVWSPQGLVNLHYPEKWGYIRFDDTPKENANFLDVADERLKQTLWTYYYLQQNFRRRVGRYAHTIADLQRAFPQQSLQEIPSLTMTGSDKQFTIEASEATSKIIFSIDHEGKLISNKR